VFKISFCSALSSQIKSVHPVSLRSTNTERNELALVYALSCQDGKRNVPQQNIPQHFPLTVHSPTWARTVAVPQGATPSRLLRPLSRPSPPPAAPEGDLTAQWVLRLHCFAGGLKEGYSQEQPLSCPVAPGQGTGWLRCWRLCEQPWCCTGDVGGPGSAASNGKPDHLMSEPHS